MSIEPQRPLHRWLNAIALALSLLLFAAWLAQVVYIISHTNSVNSPIYQKIVLFDALPPGILGGGLLIAAAVARHRRRMRGARLLGFGGVVALVLSGILTYGMGNLIELSQQDAYAEMLAAQAVLFDAKIISAIVIGGIRWRADKGSRLAQSNLPQATAAEPGGSRPVGRLPDLLSLLAVLFIWFCPVPMPAPLSQAVPLYVAGPSMFIAGFPVGLVGVLALLAAGLLRSGRDRNRLVALELFGVLALAVIFTAATMPYAMNFAGTTVAAAPNAAWIKSLMQTSWTLFASVIATKLVCIAAGFFRRRERLQFSLLGMLAFIVGCGALLMYWRVWRS